jgi:hypothetical protein
MKMKKKIISAVIFLILFSSIYLPLIPNVKAEELPDLVVSSIEITAQQPRNGQPFMLIITVTNLGSGEVPCSYLLAVNITRGTTYIDSISYGVAGNLTQDASVSLAWNFLNGLPGGKYTVRAVADPWHHYAESNETNNVLTFNFTVFTTLKLTIMSDVKNAQIVSVNGTLYTTDASGKVIITINQLGAYAVQILTPYNLNQTTRIAFVQWNDGTTSNQKTITMNTDQTYSITTKIQYYLSVTSTYGNTVGSGWYDSDSEASFSISPTTVSAGFLTYNVFKSWSGDYTGTGNAATITMNSPKEITAQWATDSSQLYLLLEILPIVIIIILVAVLLMRRKKPANK